MTDVPRPDPLLALAEVFIATQSQLREAFNQLTLGEDFETIVETDYIARNFFELFRILTQRVDAIAVYLGLTPSTGSPSGK